MGDVFTAMQKQTVTTGETLPEETQTTEAPANLLGRIDHSDLLTETAGRQGPRLRRMLPGEILEQYRAIRYQILSRAHERRLQTHLIVSHSPREGRSSTVAHLGHIFSELRSGRTLLIEADLRKPSFAKLFDRPMKPGLVQLLTGEIDDIDDAVHRTAHRGLHVLPAGDRKRSDAARLLAHPRMGLAIERAKDLYDHILIDAPALSAHHGALTLARHADHAIITVRLNVTTEAAVQQVGKQLSQVGCELTGAVLTHDRGAK